MGFKLFSTRSSGGGGDTNAIYRDGTQPPTATTPWNSQQITGLGGLTVGSTVWTVNSSGYVTATPTTLSSANVNAETLTVTLHSTSASNALKISATGAGSAANLSRGLYSEILAGKTAGGNHGAYFLTTGLSTVFNLGSLFGNYGSISEATGSNTTGWNVAGLGKATNSKFAIGHAGLSASATQASGVSVGLLGMANPTNITGALAAGYFRLATAFTASECTPTTSGVVVIETDVNSGGTPFLCNIVNGDIRGKFTVAGGLELGGVSGTASIAGNNTGGISGFASMTGLTSLSVGGAISASGVVAAFGSPCVVTRYTNDTALTSDTSGDESNLNFGTLAANSFGGNGYDLEITASGQISGDINTKNLRVAFGGTDLINFNSSNVTAVFWKLTATIKQRNSGDQLFCSHFVASTAAGASVTNIVDSGSCGETTSSDIVIGVFATGNGGTVRNDILRFTQGFFTVPD